MELTGFHSREPGSGPAMVTAGRRRGIPPVSIRQIRMSSGSASAGVVTPSATTVSPSSATGADAATVRVSAAVL